VCEAKVASREKLKENRKSLAYPVLQAARLAHIQAQLLCVCHLRSSAFIGGQLSVLDVPVGPEEKASGRR
jgi:hypothetical protein